ncbi:MAG TPA: hypothetical protein VGJ42_02375 [Nitrososphaera sp.]
MPDYYFDIETVPLEQYRSENGASFDPQRAKIISIQFQLLDSRTGQALGDLKILKEWEQGSSEKKITEEIKRTYIDLGIWNFIPVGNNLLFECKFMKYKLKQHCNVDGLKLGHRPMIDLKHTMVIMNGGSFKGYDKLLGKSGKAANMTHWYYDKNWSMIEQYVVQETKDFVKAYAVLKRTLPRIALG